MNTNKTRVGRPAAKLVYPSGAFTIQQLFALNNKTVRWELSVRQHLSRALAKRLVSRERKSLKTGSVGKPAHLFHVTKRGFDKLMVAGGSTPTEAPIEVSVEAPETPSVETPSVETPVANTVIEATMAALAPVS